MDLKKNAAELFRFTHRFGMIKGPLLFFKLKAGSQQRVKVPGVLHPLSLRKGSSDYDTFYQAIVHSQYQFNYRTDVQVIIDGGANVGLASIALKNMFPKATIIAVEPDSENFEQLNKNIKPYGDIHTVKAGLWNKEAILKIEDKYNAGKWGMVTEEVTEEGPATLKAITISKLMQQFNIETIDILKLDIETAERELFSGNYESWLPKVKVIIIELHDFMTKGTAKPFFEAINKTFGMYSFFQLGENTIIINEDLAAK